MVNAGETWACNGTDVLVLLVEGGKVYHWHALDDGGSVGMRTPLSLFLRVYRRATDS